MPNVTLAVTTVAGDLWGPTSLSLPPLLVARGSTPALGHEQRLATATDVAS